MRTFHITYYVSRTVESETGVLLGGVTILAENIVKAIDLYKKRIKTESLPDITEIKYILEV